MIGSSNTGWLSACRPESEDRRHLECVLVRVTSCRTIEKGGLHVTTGKTRQHAVLQRIVDSLLHRRDELASTLPPLIPSTKS